MIPNTAPKYSYEDRICIHLQMILIKTLYLPVMMIDTVLGAAWN